MQPIEQMLMDVAAMLQQQGRYTEASQVWEMALRLAEERLGHSHPQVAKILSDLAGCYLHGTHATTEALLKRAVAILSKALGNDHPFLAGLWHNLALVYATQGQDAKARRCERNAHAILSTSQEGVRLTTEEWSSVTNGQPTP